MVGGAEESIFFYILYIIIVADLSIFRFIFLNLWGFHLSFCKSFCPLSYWIWRCVSNNMNWSGDGQICSSRWKFDSKLRKFILICSIVFRRGWRLLSGNFYWSCFFCFIGIFLWCPLAFSKFFLYRKILDWCGLCFYGIWKLFELLFFLFLL